MMEVLPLITFWKINHVSELEWCDDNDASAFIVIVAVREHEFGTSTYLLSNRKQKKVTLNKFNVLGHFSSKIMSQFDVKTESGVIFLKEGMEITGRGASRTFLYSHSHEPFACAELERVLAAAGVANPQEQEEETSSLGSPGPPSPQLE